MEKTIKDNTAKTIIRNLLLSDNFLKLINFDKDTERYIEIAREWISNNEAQKHERNEMTKNKLDAISDKLKNPDLSPEERKSCIEEKERIENETTIFNDKIDAKNEKIKKDMLSKIKNNGNFKRTIICIPILLYIGGKAINYINNHKLSIAQMNYKY